MTASYGAGSMLAARYRVSEPLGRGRRGTVLVARDQQLDREVVIRLLPPTVSAARIAQFVHEARSAALVESKHAVKIYEVGQLPGSGLPYLVTERLRGSPLSALSKEHGPLEWREALTYVLQAGEALGEAHVRSILDGHLQPARLFLHESEGSPVCLKVLELGLASVLNDAAADSAETAQDPAEARTCLRFRAPEQWLRPETAAVRADIWALGLILYELIAGKAPFAATDPVELRRMIVTTPAPSLSQTTRAPIPPVLDAVVARCLALDAADRYEDIPALAQALSPLSADLAEQVVRAIRSAMPTRALDLRRGALNGILAAARGGSGAVGPAPSFAGSTPAEFMRPRG